MPTMYKPLFDARPYDMCTKLLFHCCATNFHKLSSLKQYTCVTRDQESKYNLSCVFCSGLDMATTNVLTWAVI